MLKLFLDNPFEELETLLNTNLDSKNHSLDNLYDILYGSIRNLVAEYYTIEEVDLKSQKPNLTADTIRLKLSSTFLDLEDIIIKFLRLKIQKSIQYYNSNRPSSVNIKRYEDILSTFGQGARMELSWLKSWDDYSLAGLHTWSRLMGRTVLARIEELVGGAFQDILRAIKKPERDVRVYSNFTQLQLGLLSKLISETKGEYYGFTNLSKTQLNNVLAKVVHTKNGPIAKPDNLNKVTFGSVEVKESDITALEKYFNNLLKNLRDHTKK